MLTEVRILLSPFSVSGPKISIKFFRTSLPNQNLYKPRIPKNNMAWKTQLVMYFNGKEKITFIIKKVEGLGFNSALGPVDFEFEWKEEPTKEQVFELCDKLCEALKGTGVIFNIDTHD